MTRNILLISSEYPPGPGGIGDHAYNLAEQLALSKHRVVVISELRQEFRGRSANSSGLVRLRLVSSLSILRNLYFVLFYLLEVGGTDVVIATGTKSVRLVGATFLFGRAKKVAILHGHETLMGGAIGRWISRVCLTKFDLGICVSRFSQFHANNYVPALKTRMIPNGFNDSKLKCKHERAKMGHTDTLRLVTVGRISRRKGQHNLIRMLPTILKSYPNLRYDLVGILDDSAECQELASELQLIDQVVFHGILSDVEMCKRIVEADIFVMLSENLPNGDVEGFGIAILEANSLGIPAIGSYGCGIEDAIQQGVNGRLVDPKDPEDTVNAINTIMNSYPQYSERASVWAKRHSWSEVSKSYKELIESL